PEGTVAAFDNFEQYEALSEEQRAKLRAVVVDHDNDPIAQISPRLGVKKPAWLDGERGRNVPESMEWVPVISFIHVLVDAMNAMVTVPGEFKSFGHDYRADTADFVQAAYGLPSVSEEQKHAIHETLVARELDRARRIKAADSEMDDHPIDEVSGAIQ
ncbi:MAG: alpha/beta-hydrolase family protein, partial [Acidimicrobiia bacterium]